jgi:hypothetical protein
MEVITWKKPAIRLNLLHLLSILFSVVMVFAFSAYASVRSGSTCIRVSHPSSTRTGPLDR